MRPSSLIIWFYLELVSNLDTSVSLKQKIHQFIAIPTEVQPDFVILYDASYYAANKRDSCFAHSFT